MVTPSARREMATKAVAHYAISIRLACQVFKVSEGCYRYQPVLADENQEIADWLLRLEALRYARDSGASGKARLATLQREFNQLAWPP